MTLENPWWCLTFMDLCRLGFLFVSFSKCDKHVYCYVWNQLEFFFLFAFGQLFSCVKTVATGTGWTLEQMKNYFETEAVNPHSNRSSEVTKPASPVVKGRHPLKALGVPSRLSGKEKCGPLRSQHERHTEVNCRIRYVMINGK